MLNCIDENVEVRAVDFIENKPLFSDDDQSVVLGKFSIIFFIIIY